mmetsp:Transcript_28730/g.53874  ORF Transcript_28730/g.53874 Transcript_28730/m.53874 type:complete len:202 (+) Transcript_28730:666-1271(+)
MARGSQPIAANTAVVVVLVAGSTGGRQCHDDVASADVGIVNHFISRHLRGHCGVNDNGSDKVAHVRRLPASENDADSVSVQLIHQACCAANDGSDHLSWDEVLIPADGTGQQDVVRDAHAQQVVQVHDQSILGDAFPDGDVARLLPVDVGQRRLRPGSIGVHHNGLRWIAGDEVRNHLAEGPREKALVHVLDGCMDVPLVR